MRVDSRATFIIFDKYAGANVITSCFKGSFDPHVIVGGAYKSIGSKGNSACGGGSVSSLHLKRYTVFARSDASATIYFIAQFGAASIRERRLFAELLWTARVLVPIAYTLAIRDTRLFTCVCATRMYSRAAIISLSTSGGDFFFGPSSHVS